jgi:hypothetical protein
LETSYKTNILIRFLKKLNLQSTIYAQMVEIIKYGMNWKMTNQILFCALLFFRLCGKLNVFSVNMIKFIITFNFVQGNYSDESLIGFGNKL